MFVKKPITGDETEKQQFVDDHGVENFWDFELEALRLRGPLLQNRQGYTNK